MSIERSPVALVQPSFAFHTEAAELRPGPKLGIENPSVELLKRARTYLARTRRPSTSAMARELRIERSVANDIMTALEGEGLVSAPNWAGRRSPLNNEGSRDRSEVPVARWVEEQARSLHNAYSSMADELDAAVAADNEAGDHDEFIEGLHCCFRSALIAIAGADGRISSRESRVINLLLNEDMDNSTHEELRIALIDNREGLDHITQPLCYLVELLAAYYAASSEPYLPGEDVVAANLSSMGQLLAGADDQMDPDELEVLARLVEPMREMASTFASEADREQTLSDTPQPAAKLDGSTATKPARTEDPIAALHKLTGLSEVKVEVETLINLARVFALRRERGLPVPDMSYHLVFAGNPGTGKTTVARIIAEVYGNLKLLSKGHLIETDRAGLVGGYVGQTAIKTSELIQKAIGGVLFIDEAYTLSAGDAVDFGKEAIDTILKYMEDNRDDLVVIVAGYTERMGQFLTSNPGLQSRFGRTVNFADYSPTEMVEIFDGMLSNSGYRLTDEARAPLSNIMAELVRGRSDTFANARDARKLFERTIAAQACRLSQDRDLSEADLVTITYADLPMLGQAALSGQAALISSQVENHPISQVSGVFNERVRVLLSELAAFPSLKSGKRHV